MVVHKVACNVNGWLIKLNMIYNKNILMKGRAITKTDNEQMIIAPTSGQLGSKPHVAGSRL